MAQDPRQSDKIAPNNSKLPAEAMQQLRAALPDCYIDTRTAGTGGGWREHPRYFTIFDIFKTSLYQPFEPVEKGWRPGRK